jgi:autotransporter-associated beta strand protein
MTLGGGATYTGATSVNGGTLALGPGGSLGNTAITVNAGGTFSPIQGSSAGASSGFAGASLTVKIGATLDLTSGGTGSVGTFTLNPGANSFAGTALNLQGGTIKFDLGSSSADQLIVNSSATAAVSGTNYITIVPASGLTSLTTGTRTLISAPGGGLAGTFKFNSGSPLNVVSPSIVVNVGANSYRLSLNSTPAALQLVVANAGPKAPVTLMPLGASITEGTSADNPYNGGGYRSKLYQYLANDGRFSINFVGTNTNLWANNPTAPNILTTANQLHNEGHFGYRTSQILGNLNGNDASSGNNGGFWLQPGNGTDPNYVTLNVGGNDYSANPNDTQVVNRLSQIISTVSALRPSVTVIVSNLAWRKNPEGASIDSRYNPYVPGMVYNLVLSGLHVQFVDMYSAISPNDSNANLSSDQVHPNQGGYNLMADTWWQSFAFGAAYWTGNQDSFWNTITTDGSTNWAANHPRSIDRQALLDAGTDVYFNASNTPLNTTLGADVSIRGLNFAAGASSPVTIAGNNTITLGTGGMTVQAGTGAHTISANVALGTAQTWSNISGNPLTVNGALSGSAPLQIVGPAFFNLGGTNMNTGAIAIDSGGIWLGDNGSLSGQGFVYVGNGGPANANVNASLLSNNTAVPIPNAIVTNKADTGSGVGAGARTIGGTNTSGITTFSGALYINGGTVLSSTAGGTTAFTNTIANGSDTGNVSRAVTIAGEGTVLLGGANSYTGGTSINSGTLQVGNAGQLPTTGFVFVGNGAPGFANVSAALLSANTTTPVGNAMVTNKADTGSGIGSGTRTIGGANNSGTVTYSGSLFINGGTVLTAAGGGTTAFTNTIANGSDTGNVSRSVTIAGNGTVRLAGNNTYSGLTTVSGGTLQLDGSVAGSVTVSNGARLTGSGTINQNLTIDSGGVAQFSTGPFTVNGTITNNGLFILSNGATISGTPSFMNNGTLDIITAGALPPNFQNHGVVIDSSVVKVRGVTRSGISMSLTIDSYTGHTYQLQYSPSLSGNSFVNIGAPQTGSTGTSLVFTDPLATGSSAFYRIVTAP